MKKIFYLLSFVIITLSSCTTNEEKLKSVGLLEEQKIIQMDQSSKLSGKISGNFFGVSGIIDNKATIDFWWLSKKNVMVFSSLPKEKIRIIIDEESKQPTVRFIFNKHWLESGLDEISNVKVEYVDFSKFINSYCLEVFIIKISSEDLKKESCLPKIN